MIARELPNDRLLAEIRRRRVAIIPIGSTEQHGRHLPVSTDSEIVAFIARKVSERTGFLTMPTIECGVSAEHHPYFNLSTTPRALEDYVTEICRSLGKNGVGAVVILNGHHGNQDALRAVPARVARGRAGPKVVVYSYWHFMKGRFDHAGFVETSIMRAISRRVNMGRAQKGLVEEDYTREELSRLGRIASRSFVAATKNGVWGDPRGATAAEGRRIISEVVGSIAKESLTWFKGKKAASRRHRIGAGKKAR
ncbi:MAG: creatininase family protein [Thaumarchaeota archaeon]|nr:creatininase family protein [Nitrososphaerota archaeon]